MSYRTGTTSGLIRQRVRTARGLLVVAVALALAACAPSVPTIGPFELPKPLGPHPVGVVSFEVPAHDGRASTMASLWYPASEQADPAPWLEGEVARAVEEQIASALSVGADALPDLAEVPSHSAQAVAAAAQGSFPVVVFSPGLDSSRHLATTLAEGLASEGIAFLALDHPGDAAAVVVRDGSVVRGTLATDIDEAARAGDQASITQLSTDAVSARKTDIEGALGYLTRLITENSPALPIGLSSHIDLTNITMMGHSMGGASALAAASLPCVRAAIDLDGTPWGEVIDSGIAIPGLVVLSDDTDPKDDPQLRAFLENSAHTTVIRIAGSRHMSFTDLIWAHPHLGPADDQFLGTITPTGFRDRLVSEILGFIRDLPLQTSCAGSAV